MIYIIKILHIVFLYSITTHSVSSYNIQTNSNFLHYLTVMKLQLPLPSPDAQASSAHLTKLIKNEIEQHQNWIPFSRFMELALYTPKYGYYSGGSHKIGTDGDFITAPTLSPYSDKPLPNNLPNYYRKQQAISTNLVQAQAISLPHSCKIFQTA